MRFMVDRTGVLAALGYVVCGLGACVPVETPAADDVTDADVSAPRDEGVREAGDDAAVTVDVSDAAVMPDGMATSDAVVAPDVMVTPDVIEVPGGCDDGGVCATSVLRPGRDGCVVQSVRITETGTWRITAAGGSGGGGSFGAQIQGDFGFVAGTELRVIVARAGADYGPYGAGGGGTYVVQGGRALVVAGGGGGNGMYGAMGGNALLINRGTAGVDGPPWGLGVGGSGGGFASRSFVAGARCDDVGGFPGTSDSSSPAYTGNGGGGGSGFEGGGGGQTGPDRFHLRGDGGDGGSSFNNGVNTMAASAPVGDGSLSLTRVATALCATGGAWCGDRCVDTRVAVDHCGACGRACALPHAVPSCAAGTCMVASCAAGFADCDGVAANGCENALDSVAHCGACRRACSPDHATGVCVAGACAVAACAAGYTDCDRDPANGCEQLGACTTITFRPTRPSCEVQTFRAPAAGVYRITAAGAGTYTSGARVRGDFTLAAGAVLSIVVGESSPRDVSGFRMRGSGGTFVVRGAAPLLVAGGSGGPDVNGFTDFGTDTTSGNAGTAAAGFGGLGGAGGRDGADGSSGGDAGDAGGGFGGQGFASRVFVPGGACESFGGASGTPPPPDPFVVNSIYVGRGGGGGYSGGGGGGAGRSPSGGRGGGGGSFNAGANPAVLADDVSTEGTVEITAL
jgi:hypothetical protein